MNEILNTTHTRTNDYELNQEVDTGKTWIDGKSIYRIVLRDDSLKFGNQNTVKYLFNFSDYGIDTLIWYSGKVIRQDGFVNYLDNLTTFSGYKDNKFYVYHQNANYVNAPIIDLILEYTKTTV